MRNDELSKLVSVAGRILLAFLFVFSQSAWAGQDQKAKDNPKPAQQAAVQQTVEKTSSAATTAKAQTEDGQAETSEKYSAEEKPSGDGKHEGIKVHGHWTIEVRNPDGRIVTHREFENALAPSPALASILARQNSVGFWGLNLYPATVCSNTNGAPCSIGELGQTALGSNSSNLSVTVSTNSLVLSGTVVAAGGGTITLVNTVAWGCPATVAPSAPCQFGSANFGFGPDGSFIFTQASLSPGISVSAGQTVAVTVNISFS